MGRPRQYASDADRQRAFRRRQEAATVRVERRVLEGLHARLAALQDAVCRAAGAGDATARACRAASPETMLEKMIAHFHRRAGDPEPAAPAKEGKPPRRAAG